MRGGGPVTVPGADVLAISALGAASRGRLVLRCALPQAGPARLDALEVTGRRIATVDVGGAPGTMVLDLGGVRPGLYFARLSQAGRRADTRVAVTR